MKKNELDGESFIWITEFDSESFKDYYLKFAEMENDESVIIIPIFISSYGGDITVAFGLRDLIKSSTKPVATIAVGMAQSAGAVLLAAGTPGFRFSSATAEIMIHEVSSGGFTSKTADLKNEAAQTEYINRKMFEILACDTGRSASDFDRELIKRKNADWFLSAEEAREWNLVDHIGIPRFYAEPAYYNMVLPGEVESAFDISVKKYINEKSSKPARKAPKKTTKSKKA